MGIPIILVGHFCYAAQAFLLLFFLGGHFSKNRQSSSEVFFEAIVKTRKYDRKSATYAIMHLFLSYSA